MHQHYYSENPESELKLKCFNYEIKNTILSFHSASGVFGFSEKVDRASALLIENFIPSGQTVLDLGCGFGAIGLFIKKLYPEINLTMIDINNRAIEISNQNAELNKLNAEIFQSNLYDRLSERTFFDIVSNPPIAAGKAMNTTLIKKAYDHIEVGGSLWLTAFHNKGGATLKKIMEETFGNVVDVDKSGGIRIYKSTKS